MIERESQEGLTILRLSHGRANALDLELCRELERTLADEERERARALVLTGRGSIFCAGVDLVRMLREGEEYTRSFLAALDAVVERLFTFQAPVVAAINGHAIAGGCVLACACDWRIAARTELTIGVPELAVGVPFPGLVLEIVRQVLPPASFREAVLFGRSAGAADALARGFVDELAPAENLLDRALAVAAELATIPPAAFALNKRTLQRPALDRAARHAAAEPDALASVWCSAEVRAAIAGYVERVLRK